MQGSRGGLVGQFDFYCNLVLTRRREGHEGREEEGTGKRVFFVFFVPFAPSW
jgi:hypothetical protein